MKKLTSILVALLMSCTLFAQSFNLLASDPLGDGINPGNDAKSLHYAIDEQSDSLWFKIKLYATTNDFFCSVCIDNDNNPNSGRSFYGNNQALKCDRTINIYYNQSQNDLYGSILNENQVYTTISQNVNILNKDSAFTFNVKLSEILNGNNQNLKLICMVGVGHVPLPNDDIPDSGYLTIPINGTGINEGSALAAGSFKVYPNPATEYLVIENSDKSAETQIEIYSPSGQLLKVEKFTNNSISIDVRDLPKGLCFLKIISGDKVQLGKAVIL